MILNMEHDDFSGDISSDEADDFEYHHEHELKREYFEFSKLHLEILKMYTCKVLSKACLKLG